MGISYLIHEVLPSKGRGAEVEDLASLLTLDPLPTEPLNVGPLNEPQLISLLDVILGLDAFGLWYFALGDLTALDLPQRLANAWAGLSAFERGADLALRLRGCPVTVNAGTPHVAPFTEKWPPRLRTVGNVAAILWEDLCDLIATRTKRAERATAKPKKAKPRTRKPNGPNAKKPGPKFKKPTAWLNDAQREELDALEQIAAASSVL